MAILALSLMAIFSLNSGAVANHAYTKKLTVASLLARSKMIDIEQELYDEGFPTDHDEESGDFSEEGWPSFKWRARILAPRTKGLSPEQLLSAVFNLPMSEGEDDLGPLAALFGAGKDAKGGSAASGGPAAGLAALGPAAGIAQGQFNQMVEQITQAVREVHLTVTWKDGKQTESIDLVTHVVSLGPGSDRNGGMSQQQAAAAGVISSMGAVPGIADQAGPWVRQDNGQVVPNPRPGPTGGMVDPRDGMPLIPQAQWLALHPPAAGSSTLPFTPPRLPPRTGFPGVNVPIQRPEFDE
ncbi:MAG: hypothetical protein HYZ28_24055 [Myxococcales bacterium]|nr:hypothetical protein [Myxococcales bacterium]